MLAGQFYSDDQPMQCNARSSSPRIINNIKRIQIKYITPEIIECEWQNARKAPDHLPVRYIKQNQVFKQMHNWANFTHITFDSGQLSVVTCHVWSDEAVDSAIVF